MPKLIHTNPLGFSDVPELGRVGGAPTFAYCEQCQDPRHPKYGTDTEHKHTKVVNESGGKPGSGCLVPDEEFDVTDDALAEHLLSQEGNYALAKPKK